MRSWTFKHFSPLLGMVVFQTNVYIGWMIAWFCSTSRSRNRIVYTNIAPVWFVVNEVVDVVQLLVFRLVSLTLGVRVSPMSSTVCVHCIDGAQLPWYRTVHVSVIVLNTSIDWLQNGSDSKRILTINLNVDCWMIVSILLCFWSKICIISPRWGLKMWWTKLRMV